MKVLILEDEALAAERLHKLLLDIDSRIEVVRVIKSVEEGKEWLMANEAPDLIISDIRLLDGLSFELFKTLQLETTVIFTTAYDQYAINAFEVNSIDYLLKPLKQEELKASLEKFKLFRQSTGAGINLEALLKTLANKSSERPERLVLNQGQKIVAVDIRDSAYFFTKDKVTFLRTVQGKTYSIDYSLEKIEEMIDPSRFFRINRHLIVNMRAIVEMYSWTKSRVKIKLEPLCELEAIVSAERSPAFKEWLKKAH